MDNQESEIENRKPVLSEAEGSKLVIILPALNEEKTVAQVLDGIPREIPGTDRVEAVVIDDGSTDATAELARQAGARVVCHGRRRGVGAAFATGIDTPLRLGADYIVNIDADRQFDPADIPALLRPLLEDRADLVTCTRFGLEDYRPDMPALKRWGNRMMCRVINWVIGGAGFTDVSCGFCAYTRETALRLNLFGDFTYTQESFINPAAQGVRMAEVPLRVREHGESRMASSLWRYGANAVPIILRTMRDVRPLKFFGMIAFGLLLGLFVFGWWAATGGTTPFRSVLIGSATFLMLGLLVGVLAPLTDMIGRARKTQEQLLLMPKKRLYEEASNEARGSDTAR